MWDSDVWYLLEWPAPAWDQGGKWDPVAYGWRLERDGLLAFSMYLEIDVTGLQPNDYIKMAACIANGDPNDADENNYKILGAATSPIDGRVAQWGLFQVTCFVRCRAGDLIRSWAGQTSDRSMTIVPDFGFDSYFNYSRMGPYPT